MEFKWETLASNLAYGAGFAGLFRYFVLKSLKDIEKVANQLNKISVKLSIFEVKIGQLERLEEKTEAQAIKISDIESRLKYERSNRHSGIGQSGM